MISTPIIEKYGENAAKKFLKIEKYMKENFAFDESSQNDIDAAADLKIGDTESERKEETKRENLFYFKKRPGCMLFLFNRGYTQKRYH